MVASHSSEQRDENHICITYYVTISSDDVSLNLQSHQLLEVSLQQKKNPSMPTNILDINTIEHVQIT